MWRHSHSSSWKLVATISGVITTVANNYTITQLQPTTRSLVHRNCILEPIECYNTRRWRHQFGTLSPAFLDIYQPTYEETELLCWNIKLWSPNARRYSFHMYSLLLQIWLVLFGIFQSSINHLLSKCRFTETSSKFGIYSRNCSISLHKLSSRYWTLSHVVCTPFWIVSSRLATLVRIFLITSSIWFLPCRSISLSKLVLDFTWHTL